MSRLTTFLGATALTFMLLGGAILMASVTMHSAGQETWLPMLILQGGWYVVLLMSFAVGTWASLRDRL